MGSEDRIGRSENLGRYPGFTDGLGSLHVKHLDSELCGESGTSKHSEVTNMTGSTEHFDIKPKIIEGKRGTNPFGIFLQFDDGKDNSMLSETHPAISDSNHSRKNMVMHPATTFNESDLVLPTKSLRSSSYCSSSASSLEHLFHVDTRSLRSSVQPVSKEDEINVPNSNSSKSKAQDKWSPGPTSTSQVSQVAHDMAPTQSPPIQVMDPSEGYDPLRIPSSIFERTKSSTQLEWSAASNESLFSIHMGNNSFSKDQFKSRELTKSGELSMFNPSAPIPDVGADKEGVDLEKSMASAESIKDVRRETRADRSQEKEPAATALQNPSHVPNHANDGTHSFAFPTVKKKKEKCACMPFFCCRKSRRKKCAWPSCYCTNCSCTFCYCSWPSCYFSWLSCYCSNCSWAFCDCWNCSLKRWCCHSSTDLTDRIKSVSVTPDVTEKQPQKPLPTELTSNMSCSCCWFSGFSCHPRCSCCCCSSSSSS